MFRHPEINTTEEYFYNLINIVKCPEFWDEKKEANTTTEYKIGTPYFRTVNFHKRLFQLGFNYKYEDTYGVPFSKEVVDFYKEQRKSTVKLYSFEKQLDDVKPADLLKEIPTDAPVNNTHYGITLRKNTQLLLLDLDPLDKGKYIITSQSPFLFEESQAHSPRSEYVNFWTSKITNYY